jgi:glutathione synthase/RimK-type ligase-like ATP-grasp enzyme
MRLAVAGSVDYPTYSRDWPLLLPALAELGITGSIEDWTDPDVDWAAYDLILAHGVWGYIHQPDAFVAWTERMDGHPGVVNSPATLRWNMDKRYLVELAETGVPTVPTVWLAPSDHSPAALPDGEIVVKPTISGGGHETARYTSEERAEAHSHIDRLLAAGRTVMVQPFQAQVEDQGEVAVILLGGEVSHTVGKASMLRPGAGAQDDLIANLVITPASASASQVAIAQATVAAAEALLGPITYARVDLVPLADGTPGVLELEVLDPALFFEFAPEAAGRLAQVLRRRNRPGA